MRRTSRRRSTSSWVSPGPRVPMPPACWLSATAPAAQAGQPVAQQGQLHLGPALGGAGVLGEDVEDHRGAVDGRPAEDLLQVALLGRGELVVEDHGVGVDRQTGRPAPRPCPGRRRWPGPGGPGAGRRGPPRRPRPCPPAGPARRGPPRVAASVPGSTTPTSTIRSRKVRSMRVPGRSVTPVRPHQDRVDHHVGHLADRPGEVGPGRPDPRPRLTSRGPPGLWTVTRSPDQPPAVGGGGGGAAPGATGQGLARPHAPTPGGPGRRRGPARATNSTLIPPGWTASRRGPSAADVDAGGVRARTGPGGGCPCRPRRAAPVGRTRWGWSSPEVDRAPCRRRRQARPGRSPAVVLDGADAGRGGHRETRAGRTRPASTAAWARQRMPLPLISAAPPSALRSSIDELGAVPAGGDPDDPVGPDPAVAVAQGAGPAPARAAACRRRSTTGPGSRCPRRGAW